MTGRGIDQILLHPSEPAIHEHYVQTALAYVQLAEKKNGPIPRSVDPTYIWGDAMPELDRVRPAARVVNLETAVTRSNDWLDKGINYRMNPSNIACLTATGIDCCALANNHVLDWGASGLMETLDTLHAAGLKTAGAGKNQLQAEAPAVVPVGDGQRLLIFSLGAESSGVPHSWAATERAPGVAFLADLSRHTVERIARNVRSVRQAQDIVIASVHWGSNWGYGISPAEVQFAHELIEHAGVDLFHGHSSHHPKGLEVFCGKLIIYGCGDFINDYEGIAGHESFRGDLACMYFPTLDTDSGQLLGLEVVPLQAKRFRLQGATQTDASWLCSTLDRESRRFATSAILRAGQRIVFEW